MTGSDKQHWEQVYSTKPADTVSWFQPSPVMSLTALDRLGARSGQSLIDIGGASTLMDALLDRSWATSRCWTFLKRTSRWRKGDLGQRRNWLSGS